MDEGPGPSGALVAACESGFLLTRCRALPLAAESPCPCSPLLLGVPACFCEASSGQIDSVVAKAGGILAVVVVNSTRGQSTRAGLLVKSENGRRATALSIQLRSSERRCVGLADLELAPSFSHTHAVTSTRVPSLRYVENR